MAGEEPLIKKLKLSTLSDHVYSAVLQDRLSENWQKNQSVETTNLILTNYPFRVCKISNFIKNESFMEELKNELSDVKSRRQSIDLYQFEQTSDLSTVETENLRNLYETFECDLTSWMEKITKIKLYRKISMSSSCYSDTDYLLCHDDNMGDRRIAFVLYLSKNWTPEDGGSLDIFDTDEKGQPRNVVRSFVPEYNSLVFFEVVKNSYHQVAEVTSSEKSRWTINGWFHGPIIPENRPSRSEPSLTLERPQKNPIDLVTWITETYLAPEIVKEIQKNVESKSYTFLKNFVKSDVYENLSHDVESKTIDWIRVGPADVRNYEIADEKTLPTILQNFYDVFKSLVWFKLLKDYTELDLVPDVDETMDPKMSIELQRWSKGCYTLICDRPTNFDDQAKSQNGISSSPTPTSNGGGSSSCVSSKSRRRRKSRLNSVSSCDNDDNDERETQRTIYRDKNVENVETNGQTEIIQRASCSKIESRSSSGISKRGGPVNPDSEDSDVSDIGDYLSDPLDCSLECSEVDDDAEANESSVAEPGSLDVIVQFHTEIVTENDTIDYVDPREQDGALIHVPAENNHLCIVYKNVGTTRLHKYVNHYCKGYFYNLVCTYHE